MHFINSKIDTGALREGRGCGSGSDCQNQNALKFIFILIRSRVAEADGYTDEPG
jgi:hypothetical protein